MKNYNCKIAAQKMVWPHTQLGVSRHQNRVQALGVVTSVLTEKAHVSALAKFAQWLLNLKGKHLKNACRQDAVEYLEERALTRRQSTVDLDRQAMNMHLGFDKSLAFVAAKIATVEEDRAYTQEQIELLVSKAADGLALSVLLACDAGLRGMELITLSTPELMLPSARATWSSDRFAGRRSDVPYVVHGKGGLCREVRISPELSQRTCAHQRMAPVRVSHRGAHLTSCFDLCGGHKFAVEFSSHSLRVLGFTHGAHGLRHSFAQRRRIELLCAGFSVKEMLLILSQELGHFHTQNTLTYLRDQLF